MLFSSLHFNSVYSTVQLQLVQQCIQISTRINSSSVHTYIFVCFTLRVILQGFVDPIMQHNSRLSHSIHLPSEFINDSHDCHSAIKYATKYIFSGSISKTFAVSMKWNKMALLRRWSISVQIKKYPPSSVIHELLVKNS